MMNRPAYLVYAPPYDPDSGGCIFLHELVNALNALGQKAMLWPWHQQPPSGMVAALKARLRRSRFQPAPFATNPALNTPVATPADFTRSSIVVYPEVTLGNPLGARNIARWLLYTPGIKDPFEFTEGEMFFCAGKMSDIPDITGGAPELFLWRRNPAYRNQNRAGRSGTCFIVRKGAHKDRIPETENAIPVDGLPHEEIAEIFNRCDTFYSYDEATFYSQYAAICGCQSVVIPGVYASRAEWTRNHELGRYGIAYGTSAAELEHAAATRHLVDGLLQEQEDRGLKTVENFIALTQDRFR